MTIGVDFDGVIHSYERGWMGGVIYGTLVPGTTEALKTILEAEAAFVYTARDDLAAVADWIQKETGIDTRVDDPYETRSFWNRQGELLVTNRKYPARAYLDDRGVRFTRDGGWDQALRDLSHADPVTIHSYLVTVRLPKNGEHDPRNKKTAVCPANQQGKAMCTDHTGEHHTILVQSLHRVETVEFWARERFGHVTRVEYAGEVFTLS